MEWQYHTKSLPLKATTKAELKKEEAGVGRGKKEGEGGRGEEAGKGGGGGGRRGRGRRGEQTAAAHRWEQSPWVKETQPGVQTTTTART